MDLSPLYFMVHRTEMQQGLYSPYSIVKIHEASREGLRPKPSRLPLLVSLIQGHIILEPICE